MGQYRLRWALEGNTWKAILDDIQPTVQDLAKSWQAVLARERGDMPGIDVRWYTPDEMGRSIQISIEGTSGVYEIHINGSAWKDFDQPPSPRVRKWKLQHFMKISVPPDLKVDLGRLKDNLHTVHHNLSGWTQRDLSTTEPLPPRDPNLAGKIVYGQYQP